jgi:nuclear GTP-binding protein
MVKKKGKSKRITLKDKYKIQRRVVETHRKRKKKVKRDAKAGIVRHDKSKKDPGIPNSWPFKQDLLKDIQRARERQQQQQLEAKEARKGQLNALREHMEQGGTAKTVEDLMAQANRDRAEFEAKPQSEQQQDRQRSDGTVEAGQASRRAYLRELKKVIDTSDVLLQVLDARDPFGSRIHPSIENLILSRTDKKMVLVLNKIDLVPKDVVGQWLAYLRRSHPTIAIKASNDRSATAASAAAVQGTEEANKPAGMEGLLQLLKNYARTGGTGGKNKTTIVVGVIGYPNTGKSSIINALKRTRAVGVSPRPGFTTSMQEVVLDRNVRLLDSPGVVFDDRSALLGNCVDADSIEDPIPAVAALLERCNPASLIMAYNIPAFPPGNVMMFLAMVARSYGRVLKGGIPDKVAAARAVLRDWNQGKIPYYTPPPKTALRANDDAVVVSQFGEEFDVSKYDDELMKSLKDTDEMDFVEMSDDKKSAAAMGKEYKEAINYLAGEGSDEDEEMEEDSDHINERVQELHVTRSQLERAEDYDFDDM